jgi:signal transduction histidine kinase/GAF domain-containing protein
METDSLVNKEITTLQTPDRAIELLSEVSRLVTSILPTEFLQLVPEKACSLLSAPVCVLWKLDPNAQEFRVIGTAGTVDGKYKDLALSLTAPNVQRLLAHLDVSVLPNVTEHPSYTYHAEAKAQGWISLISTPLRVGSELVGLLDVYTYRPRNFAAWEKHLFTSFGCLTAEAIQKAELLQGNHDRLIGNKRLEQLTEVMLKLTEKRTIDDLLWQLLRDSLSLVNQTKGCITRTDYKSGEQVIVRSTEKKGERQRLGFEKGIIGQAVATQRPVRENNVLQNHNYHLFWQDTKSELAIPILINDARVLVERKIQLKPKLIGVINLESSQPGAFSEADENCIWVLARYAALMIERIEFDQKLEGLRLIEKRIAGNRDFDQTIRLVIEGIIDTLGYEFVNISLVAPQENLIETKYIEGLTDEDVTEFKKLAKHSLDSDDIQASMVRSPAIEVPDKNDERLDNVIARRFNHDQLVRVFIPMIGPASKQVIGTVEAGYKRQFRPYIYDKDVLILKGFVEHAVQLLEQNKPGMIERLIHELKSPIVGIRSHASLLQRRRSELSDDLILNKFDDIISDSEILLQQVGKLSLFFGHPIISTGKKERREKTVIFKDIVIKTINQLKPQIKERGFDLSKIEYRLSDVNRVALYVNKAQISQVVFNLLMNAVKYAEDDSQQFRLSVRVDEDEQNFILKFSDWGIGVKKGLEEKIFGWGFRTSEAIDKNVSGTGLGLTVAREIMRDIKGDLKLVRNYKPTEFYMILPKKLQETS